MLATRIAEAGGATAASMLAIGALRGRLCGRGGCLWWIENFGTGWIWRGCGGCNLCEANFLNFLKIIHKPCELVQINFNHHVEYTRYAEDLGGQDKTLFQPKQSRTTRSERRITCAHVEGDTYGIRTAVWTSMLPLEEGCEL